MGYSQYGLQIFNVENYPDLYGGKSEYRRFLTEHLVYPKEDFNNKTQGKVVMFFIVTKQGKAAKAKVTQSLSSGLDREALRLLTLMEWIPSYKMVGDTLKAVNVMWSLTIKFSLKKYSKWVRERGFDQVAFSNFPSDSSFNIFEHVDTVPKFNIPGQSFVDFVSSNYQYPKLAALQDLKGEITLTFVIEPDGYTTNIHISEGVAGGCNEEMIRVIGLTKWIPAVKNGKYVRYRQFFAMELNLRNVYKDNSSGSQRGWGQ